MKNEKDSIFRNSSLSFTRGFYKIKKLNYLSN